jgi:tRNA threonylcarbamoyladenosine biosynthesis protein TsaB
MKILAVDTSTPTCTVGIVSDDQVLAEYRDSSGQTHARHLMGMIDNTLSACGTALGEVDGFAVVTGPGTFTGLRIGIGTVKGLAFALSRPVVGVTSLAALAAQADLPTTFVCPVMDARRNEVYYGLYASQKGKLNQMGDHGVGLPMDLAKDIHGPCQFLGQGARLYRETFEALLGPLCRFSQSETDTIHAKTIARLAMDRFQKNDIQPLQSVAPHYIRRSDAELRFGSRSSFPPSKA